MKTVYTVIVFCLLLIAPVQATPDRGVWVIDTIVGLSSEGYIIKQYVYDNMGSHYQGRVQVFLVEKDLRTHKVIKSVKVTEYIESIDPNTGGITRSNRSEDKIAEIIKDNPQLFYDIYYIFPVGLPNGHRERCVLANNEIVRRDGNGDVARYKLDDLIKLDVPAERIIQEYEAKDYLILLIEFGEPSYESNYYQKIVVIRK